MKSLALWAALALPTGAVSVVSTTAMADTKTFYIGTYTGPQSKGIYRGTLDSKSGQLGALELLAEAPSPSFVALSPNEKFLYAALESGGGAVGAWALGADGKATKLNEQPAGGGGACHVWVDKTGKTVFVANYGGGSIAAFPVKEDGSLGERTAFFQFTGSGPNKGRQEKPHAHSIYTSPDNRFVYACDLGTDEVKIYRFDAKTSTLTPGEPPVAKVPPGSGPRHLEFHPKADFVYVCNEMLLTVTAFARDKKSGALTEIQTLSSLPEGAVTKGASIAEIFAHPSGKWLYVSNRGHDTIAVFEIGKDGKLTLIQNAPTPKVPRGFALSPDGNWLVVGGQSENKIAVLKIDRKTGKLEATEQSASVGAPVAVLFAK